MEEAVEEVKEAASVGEFQEAVEDVKESASAVQDSNIDSGDETETEEELVKETEEVLAEAVEEVKETASHNTHNGDDSSSDSGDRRHLRRLGGEDEDEVKDKDPYSDLSLEPPSQNTGWTQGHCPKTASQANALMFPDFT
jgi:hypothetical protein